MKFGEVDFRQALKCLIKTGDASAIPASVGIKPGAMSNKAAAKQTYCSHLYISTKKYLLSAAASMVMPRMQPIKVMVKSYIVKPFATKSKDGENTKTKGTRALAIPNLKAMLPVLKGSPPAIPAAA